METKKERKGEHQQSITVKALIVALIAFALLIPQIMIMNLIDERETRNAEVIQQINRKWSDAQTICGPVLTVPYTVSIQTGNKDEVSKSNHELHITPQNLVINAELLPEEKYYGIYKAILYKSELGIQGNFYLKDILAAEYPNTVYHWERAYLTFGLSDLKGISQNVEFVVNNRKFGTETGNTNNALSKEQLVIRLQDVISPTTDELAFQCSLNLKGSKSLNFIPMGRSTQVNITGEWKSPGFIGNFSPESTIESDRFSATWDVLYFNRNIPSTWIDNDLKYVDDSSFGVSLVDPVNHYQQNTRSAKYALLFVALTFAVFFFVELNSKKRIHPVQYILVGIALLLFYTLLLSISEQVGFSLAYIIASVATIALIVSYAYSIFKNKTQTIILSALLVVLYTFLYVILQLEDVALLIGSIGLFIILGVSMYFSRKIDWYNEKKKDNEGDDNNDKRIVDEIQIPDLPKIE